MQHLTRVSDEQQLNEKVVRGVACRHSEVGAAVEAVRRVAEREEADGLLDAGADGRQRAVTHSLAVHSRLLSLVGRRCGTRCTRCNAHREEAREWREAVE